MHAPPSPLLLALSQRMHWLRRLVAWQTSYSRARFGQLADDPQRGLLISDEEAELLAAGPFQPDEELIAERQTLLVERNQISDDPHSQDPFAQLGMFFGLTPIELDLLLLALGPEIDGDLGRIYGYIQDDVTRKLPTVGLAQQMLCTSPLERLSLRALFAPEAPLLKQRLLRLEGDGPLPQQSFQLDPRISAFCCALELHDPQIANALHLHKPQARKAPLLLDGELAPSIASLVERSPQQPLVLLMRGANGSGRRAIPLDICGHARLPLLEVSLRDLREQGLQPREACQRVIREARLSGAAILWSEAQSIIDDESAAAWRHALWHALDETPLFSVVALRKQWRGEQPLRRATVHEVQLTEPSRPLATTLWKRQLGNERHGAEWAIELASLFRLSPGQIKQAARNAFQAASLKRRGLQRDDLLRACRDLASDELAGIAQRIVPRYQWGDLILAEEPFNRLKEISIQLRHRQKVLDEWGFEQQLAMGKGLVALFAGESGTGKTMAAEVIAAELGLELYKIDLSALVSKYIGETEKNLDKIFNAAREANALLFFDEADAIFGKRSEIGDSHDRYANIEVGYLLQRIEAYDGVVILATNLRNNLDDAFLRRLHVSVDFPFPKPPERLRIWQRTLPSKAPLASEVNLNEIAERYELAGGNIRNAVLLAAYLAAEEGHEIAMRHIHHAVRREYQKLGRMLR